MGEMTVVADRTSTPDRKQAKVTVHGLVLEVVLTPTRVTVAAADGSDPAFWEAIEAEIARQVAEPPTCSVCHEPIPLEQVPVPLDGASAHWTCVGCPGEPQVVEPTSESEPDPEVAAAPEEEVATA